MKDIMEKSSSKVTRSNVSQSNMFKLIDINGINYKNDTFSSDIDGYDINQVVNCMNVNHYLISMWYLMNISIFSNIKSIIDDIVGQNWCSFN